MTDANDKIIEKLDKENVKKIKSLFNDIQKNSEFEFIFFSKRDKHINLTLEKYIILLKFLKKRSQMKDKNYRLETIINMDVGYNPDKDTSYRVTIENKETIDKYLSKFSKANNHVIFRNLVLLSKKDKNITLMKKKKEDDKTIDIDDLYLRVRLSDELELDKNEIAHLLSIDETTMNSIFFRYKERVSFYVYDEKNSYVKIDLTVTKTEMRYDNINSSIPKYELEIETKSNTLKEELLNIMFAETEILFKVLQQSNFIITRSETEKVIQLYKELLIVPKANENQLYGRQPVSLEIQYVEQLSNKYAVTDKADGERHFLMILENKCYLMNKNLDVKYTGIVLKKENMKYNNTVLDGELIFLKGRHLFLVFDCLFFGGIDVRKVVSLKERLKNADEVIDNCFVFDKQKGMNYEEFSDTKNFNLYKHMDFHKNQIKKLFDNLNSDIEINKKFLLVRRKYFIHSLGAKNWEIYAYSSMIWNAYTNDSSIKCPYVLDGLIYQPNDQAYVSNAKDSKFADYKWKPPEKNSIDFYIEFEKDQYGNIISVYDNSYDDIGNDHNDTDFGGTRLKNQVYKICKLFVGQSLQNFGNNRTQVPVPFKENEDLNDAYLLLKDGEIRDIENNILSDKTVVEFYYNTNNGIANKFRWVPIKTRYDKTEAVIRYKQQYGNYITSADRIWKSIVNPVLMSDFDELAKGNEPEKNIYYYDKKLNSLRERIGHELIVSASKENKYFQKITNLAKPMRSFHNFMKDNLIYTYCHSMYNDNKQKSILDIGVGKGQDIMKFYYAKVKFVVGIDIDKEALVFPLDGAISRYNKLKKGKPGFPKMEFIQADFTAEFDYDNQFKSLGGMENSNKQLIERYFSKNSKTRAQFDVINAQFSIHYAFKDRETFTNLKNNINNYLRNDGYLLISTFDAMRVRQLLKNKDKFTQEYTDEDGNVKVLFEILKKYDDVNDDVIMGTGNTIDVHMSWISNEGVYLTEYLIDSRFLVEELKKDCDLELVTDDLFQNQYLIHKEFITNFIQYEADERTRNNFMKIQEYYKNTNINNGCKTYTDLERFYVFRKKKDSKKVQNGGDFNNTQKFFIPQMETYNNEYSFMNSIYHVLRSQDVIPKSLSAAQFYSDMNIEMINDGEITNDKIKEIAKNIIIYHEEDDKKTKMLNGLNIVLTERDCNDEFDIDVIKRKKKLSENDYCVIIMREGNWYVPIYSINKNNNKEEKNGLFCVDDDVVRRFVKE